MYPCAWTSSLVQKCVSNIFSCTRSHENMFPCKYVHLYVNLKFLWTCWLFQSLEVWVQNPHRLLVALDLLNDLPAQRTQTCFKLAVMTSHAWQNGEKNVWENGNIHEYLEKHNHVLRGPKWWNAATFDFRPGGTFLYVFCFYGFHLSNLSFLKDKNKHPGPCQNDPRFTASMMKNLAVSVSQISEVGTFDLSWKLDNSRVTKDYSYSYSYTNF